MFNGKNAADMEQGMALLRDHFVPALWSFYTACLSQGFDKDQSMMLLIQWMTITMNNASSRKSNENEE